MKDLIKRTVLSSGALRLAASFRVPSIAILMYHSVLPDPSKTADFLGEIPHSEAIFRSQMELLARDFHPISLDRAGSYVSGKGNLPRRSVVVTFDDGYVDNYEVAMPILNQLAIPATFYVTVDSIEKNRLPWPGRLRFAFRNTKLGEWADTSGNTRSLKLPIEREKAFLAMCDACAGLSSIAQEEFVRRIERDLRCSTTPQAEAFMMNYDHLRALIRHGHIVGSHTMTHPNMACLKEDDALREFAESKRILESQLGLPVKHFAYPCPALTPHWNARTLEQSHAVGYETAVTTNNGLAQKGDNPLCLKRIRPTKTVDGLRWNLESAFAGRAV